VSVVVTAEGFSDASNTRAGYPAAAR